MTVTLADQARILGTCSSTITVSQEGSKEHVGMADDVLVEKLFNYICGSGGFVELSVLLKHDSPLGSRKSAGEAEIWLKNQRKFGLVKDRDGNIAGVRVDFRKKLCQQYVSKGSCRKTAGFCQHWHICKKFIEGKCSVHDNCGLSHNFRIGPNRDLLKELCLEKYPNGSLRKIIAWSLPHVCQSYLRGKCQPHKCSYIHACYKEIQGLQCRCSLSHSLFDNGHNLAVLNLYDIVPTNVAFVRCSVLCLGEDPHSVHQDNSSHETSFLEGETAISETSSTGTEVQMLNSNTSTMTAAKSTPATLSDVSGEVTNPAGAILASGISPNSRFRGVGASDYLFRRLCKEFKCTVPLSELLERKVVLFNELQDFKNIVDENPDKLLAFPDERGVISPTSRISAICPKLRLCHDHVSNNECKKTDCHNFHLCRKFITGCCSRGERCFRNHSFQNRRDRNTLFQLQLDGLTDEQLRHLMLASLPQVCNDYNKGTCSLGVFCFRVHICKQFVINSCPNESVCSLDHYRALQSQRTRSLIQRLRFHPTNRDNILNTILVYEGEEPDSSPKTKGEVSDTINHLASSDSGDESTRSEPGTSISNKTTTPEALNENLVYEGKEYCNPKTKGEVSSRVSDSGDESTRSQERSESVTSVSNKTTTSKALNENLVKSQKSWTAATASQRSYGASLGNENESYPITQRSETNERAPCYPDKWHVFQTLCREYDCSTSLKEIAKRPDLFPHGISSAESWFRRTVGNFLIKESDTKTEEISRIDAFSADARLCLSWVENQTCHEEHCQCFHVCKSYISDSCSLGASCPMNHSFRNDRDRALLSKVRLDCLSEEQLCKLVLLSSPQVCKDYNNSICTSGNSCGKIHICCGYLRNCCRGVWECGLEHEGTFNTKQTQDVLQHLRMNNISSKNTLKLIFDDKRCLTSKDKMTKCLIHVDKPDAPICLSFLVGTCKLGEKCSDHHCPLPYHWQYKVPNVEVWNSFSEKDNVTLERLYCDVNNARMNYKPVEILDFSLAGSTVVSPAQEYTITVDLDDMVIFLTPLNSQGTRFISELRRLSTVDGSVAPRSEKSMNWIWYWEENGKVWRTYDKDCSERDLQKLMEQAYLDYLKQGAERENTRYFRFAVAERKYDLVFSRTEMHQINLRSGTKRRVRRRPGKVISNEDMEDLKWWYGDSSFQEEVLRLLRAEKKYFPSHWSSMPPKSEYYRANVDRSSEEFKDLEKLFRSTMNDYTVRIENIDRVQNLFMLEKYCRKKECMTATAARSQQTVDERKLFHGTTPDAVEDICKHNFDWRLHGRNTSVFGEGSYFARDASNSHTFAKEDASGFRHVFVAKVLVGSYTKGHSSYRRPPPKVPSDPRSNLYDSCVDNQSNPSVFVVFDTDQLYPEYIITYSTVSRSDSSDSHHDSSSQRGATPKMASPKTGDPVVPLEQDPSSSQAQASHQTSTTLTREIVQTPSSQTLASTKGPTSRSTYSTTTIASSQEEPSLPNSPSATGNTSNSTSMLSTLRNQFPSKFPSSEQKKDHKCLIS